MAKSLTSKPDAREMDMLMATGEQQAIALMAIALQAAGVPAVSLTGPQVGIITENVFGKARIRDIATARLEKALEEGQVAVVAGFQGATEDLEFTTLGRGGSDITAVAVAAALKADLCEFYKDVDGIFTTDPRVAPSARKIDRISYDEMLELASLGAGVLQSRSVEFAKNYNVPLHVRSYLHDQPGTYVVPEEKEMEDVVVSGVAFNRAEAKIILSGLPDRPGIAAEVFGAVGEAGIVVDMIIQDTGSDGLNDITFTVSVDDYDAALAAAQKACKALGGGAVTGNKNIAKVSAVGVGMRSHANVAARMFKALASRNINIQMISTSEIKVSCVIDAADVDRAVQAIHDAFADEKKVAGR
jgi:aspartate kinase